MELQNFEKISAEICEAFEKLKSEQPERLKRRLNLSWSNWGFGAEDLATSAERLQKTGIEYIELHGNHYGADLGYKVDETLEILDKFNTILADVEHTKGLKNKHLTYTSSVIVLSVFIFWSESI